MTDEVWKDIPGFEGYQISNQGRVRSCRWGSRAGLKFKGWRFITPNFSSTRKHMMIDLVDPKGVRRGYGLHRLLYEIFVSPIPDGLFIDHIDRNGLNNSLENLRLADRSTNVVNQKIREGRKYKGVYPTKAGTFAARTCYQGKAKHFGTFKTEREAAEAYNKYALEMFGEFAVLNVFEEEMH